MASLSLGEADLRSDLRSDELTFARSRVVLAARAACRVRAGPVRRAELLSIAPLLVLFLLAGRQLVSGIMSGALKS